MLRALLRLAGSPVTFGRVEDQLADADHLGSDFDALILGSELDRLLQRQLPGSLKGFKDVNFTVSPIK